MEYQIPAWVEIKLSEQEEREADNNDQNNHRSYYCYLYCLLDGVVVMTDTARYKSVAVKIPSYKKLKAMADQDYRSVASFVEYLVDKESEERRKSNGK